MRYQYVVILKKNSERLTDLLSILLCLFSAFSFLFFAISSINGNHLTGADGDGYSIGAPGITYVISAAAIILLAGLVINLLARRRSRNTRVRYRYLLILAAIGWIGMTSAPWIGLFFFLAAFLEYQTKRPLEIGFHHDRVVINTLIKQRHDWSVFNNIILKDGLLTLDFKSNRLMQKEVAEDEEEDDADEEEFNAYCRSCLTAADRKLVGGNSL
jgi:hypothetical protein